jgi:AcrR family transcriptional regulator
METSQDKPKTGLRERKKARTRAEIQRQALRLFREQGYEATTVARIAEASEVSESTFFRYFPTKEEVVLWDDLDPLIFEAFKVRPPELGAIQALRESISEVLARTTAGEQAQLRERLDLLLSVPPLRATLVDRIGGPMRLLAEAIAARAGKRPDDPAVRAVAGAVLGVGLSAMFAAAGNPDADVLALLDEGLAQLEDGFPL